MKKPRIALKQAYSYIKKRLSDKDASPWVTDNFYIIDRHYRSLLKDISPLSEDIFGIIFDYCRERDFCFDVQQLTEFLRSRRSGYSLSELSAIKPIISASAIISVAELMQERERFDRLKGAILKLSQLDNPEYDEIIPLLWAPEAILAEREYKYTSSDRKTKASYRFLLARYAKRENLSEEEAVLLLAERAEREKRHIGSYLFAPRVSHKILWCACTFGLISLLLAVSFYYIGYLSLLLLIPFAAAASSVSDILVSALIPALPAPRLKLKAIPDNAKTLVAVASLLGGEDGEIFESLARFCCMNPDGNIYFCLLADLPDCRSQYRADDSAIINNARERIDELNRLYGERFCLFLRERVLNESEDCYGGRERKRGAVCELIEHIINGGKSEYYGGDFIREIKYLLTLDSDTNLSLDSVNELVSVALHPLNTPHTENGRVVRGYGIIQPSVVTSLKSGYTTSFSRLISGAGGADPYASAAFSRAQGVFGSGMFCGKGLIDISLFHRHVVPMIPDGLVLSHDIIEGSIIRTLSATDIILTDSTPKNTVSYFRRAHRWMRGDFQNLYFLASAGLSRLAKWRIFLIAAKHLSPVFTLLTLCLAGTQVSFGLSAVLLAFSELLLPSAIALLRFILAGAKIAPMRFFSKACSMLSQTLLRLFFEISSCARRALLASNALILAVTRLVTRKKTLQWTTAAQTDMLSSSLGKYVLDGLPSSLIGLALLALAIPPFIRLFGLFFFVYPLISISLSKSLGGGMEVIPTLSEGKKRLLAEHCADMISFYTENVNGSTNHLPPDNIQLSPTYDTAYRTSPTNIGFYLVSMLAARDMRVISTRELYERLHSSLLTVCRLEKCRGNLYNWYDVKTLAVLGDRYSSAVDSGNFLTMLVALKQGLYDYLFEDERIGELIAVTDKLISETDLSMFYDEQKELFRIGVADLATPDNSCYDMLMSESRLASYYAVATHTVPKAHWRALNRTLTSRNGYMGMMSWSGTAFEYLMPQLFLPLYRDSFIYESIAFSLMLQRRESTPWGISESGFYSFDSEMHYQYKANGVPALALRRIGDGERVVSPYSTYLSLCFIGSSAIKNLKDLEARGMYGKYGLYEALDLNRTSAGLCVKSYMAHHIGMSVIAIANAVKGNIFIKRFMSDPFTASASELLQEKIPTDAHIFEDSNAKPPTKRNEYRFTKSVSESSSICSPTAELLTRGDLSAVITSIGHIGLKCGDRAVAHTRFSINDRRFTPAVVFARNGKSYTCTSIHGGLDCSFERGNGSVSHICSGRDFSGRVRYSISRASACFVIESRAEANKRYDVTLAFEPVLESEKKYLSHISFSKLFVESEYDKKSRILYFHRRSSLDGRHIFSLAVALREKDARFSFLASREGIRASSLTRIEDLADIDTDCKVGAVIDPLCLVRAENADGGRVTFLVACGETKNECLKSIELARAERGDYHESAQSGMAGRLLPYILYRHGAKKSDRLSEFSVNTLWSKGISGDHPIILAYMTEPAVTRTEALLSAFAFLSRASIRTELIFITDDKDRYNRPAERSLRERCERQGLSHYINANGGIFILRIEDIGEELFSALKRAACFYFDFYSDPAPLLLTAQSNKAISLPQASPMYMLGEGDIKSSHGFFGENGFTADKSTLPDSPYSYILTGRRFSAVVTQSSLGYSFFDNARERRICSFYGDRTTIDNGERIFAEINETLYDLCACSQYVTYEKGVAVYRGSIGKTEYSLTVTVHPKYPVKLVKVEYHGGIAPRTRLCIDAVMGNTVSAKSGIDMLEYSSHGNECIIFKSIFGMSFPEGYGFAGVCGGTADAEGSTLCADGASCIFFIGAAQTKGGAENITARVNGAFFDTALTKSRLFAESMIPKIKIKTNDELLNRLMNLHLPYQVAACRFFARGSFYQSGGAYGFRDQLQDCLTLVYSNADLVRTHLIRCCAHQYVDGTVMHWWHTRNINGVNSGIKSKCSDDLLYLPIVLADYIEKTGDDGLLSVTVYYLDSPPLERESERYETPARSDIRESVYRHCLRALYAAERIGRHGLILMGSCDWNDAFSLVGEKGIGESVFSTMLYIVAAEAFLPFTEKLGDTEASAHLRERVAFFRKSIEKNAFFGDRYARAFCDDGTVIGIKGCEECEIDILSQAFAVLAGLNPDRARTALKVAFDNLYDRKNKILRLFSPPFTNGRARVGYIRGYVAGIRENGGMYTHGALWGALACLKVGFIEEALLILDAASPAKRSACKDEAGKYKNEPYAVSADIYGGDFGGRGGWSWYTGAASWYYRIVLEHLLGLRFGAGSTLISAKPRVELECTIDFDGARLKIIADNSIKAATLDNETVSFPLAVPNGEHTLYIPTELTSER